MKNNIKRCMKKAKENWIGEQCCEIEENLRKNNSKRTYQQVKDLTTVKQGKATTVLDSSEKCLTEEREMDTEDDHPIRRKKGGCNTITEEREVS